MMLVVYCHACDIQFDRVDETGTCPECLSDQFTSEMWVDDAV